jgi:4-alpha-glucanotransferase
MNDGYFLNTKTGDKWQRVGTKKRAGVAVPLFSIYSSSSVGIGEIPDLKLLADWCTKTGMSIIQLLPLNDVGGDFAPYNSISSFALDPMYLAISKVKGLDLSKFSHEIEHTKKKYRPVFKKVNYRIKKAKIELLWEIYKVTEPVDESGFENFTKVNAFWLKDYSVYRVISELLDNTNWEKWPDELKQRDEKAIDEVVNNNYERVRFHKWLQWQLYLQLLEVKDYAGSKGIFIMGDLPYLVSRESADVWAHKENFLLQLSSGAPPDMYFASGQKWGMPPYNWNNIATGNFEYLTENLKYASNFYDMYRIDHFVGLFRVWVSPVENSEHPGDFLPKEEYIWEAHGRKIIDVMVNSSPMLPCAEDLGTVPGCSYHVLYEYGIPGIDFQRFYKSNFAFRHPGEYRINSSAVVSTHDSNFWVNWWQFEAGTIDERLFEIMCMNAGMTEGHLKYVKDELFERHGSRYGRLRWKDEIDSHEKLKHVLQLPDDKANDIAYIYMESFREKERFLSYLALSNADSAVSSGLVMRNLERINQSNSIFSIQLMHEYLCLDEGFLSKISKWNYRLNTPGVISRNNWSLVLPLSLERLLELEINEKIKSTIQVTERV